MRITTLNQPQQGQVLSRSELEIIIPREDALGTSTIKLLTSSITPVCSPKLFDARERPQQPTDLLQMELIHVLGYANDWHRWFSKHGPGKAFVPRGLSVDGSLIAIEAAQRGDGIMLGRRPFIDRHLESGELVEVFTKPYYLFTDYYLNQPPKNLVRREAKIVANWLTELADPGG